MPGSACDRFVRQRAPAAAFILGRMQELPQGNWADAGGGPSRKLRRELSRGLGLTPTLSQPKQTVLVGSALRLLRDWGKSHLCLSFPHVN